MNKATHPTNRQEDWEYIIGFCDQINKELEGPQIAVRLLVHKIHSPQEWEAMQALTVLEACMKNCGRRFHNEIAKYRFLNELIKVVSPKYMGDSVPERVKMKIIEMLYSWTVAFPNEAKISDAYQTLRRQGLISSDPELTADKTLIPSPPTRPKNPVFDNEDMGKLLAELLRSKNPEDLQEANRLIKNMVKEDDVRVQKLTKRMNTLEEVNNNVKLLGEMLSHYDRDMSSDSDRELLKELYERCDKLRRTAFKLATETEDNDTNLGKVLPVTAYDKDGVRVLLHFATDCPPGRPDVLVIVVSMLNTAPLPVQNIVLQAAVPKTMKVKLQSPSGAELAPFNPILPPSSITQVMLLANPLKEKVRLRYKLMFLLGERQYCEVGEVDQFPPAERWGNL
uniref:Golgi associated, gamma adaptin ear containing, ARF binding protein 3b n=1 Tax=Astyanax mexicanus TaxID=7994 RepID=A0A8B9HDG0_ASTMX